MNSVNTTKKRQEAQAEEIDLVRLFGLFFHKLWLIILVAAIFGAGAYFGTKEFITPLYEAEARMYVNNSSVLVGSAKLSITSGDLSASQKLVDSYVVVLKSRPTIEKVIEETGVPYSYETLSNMIEATSINDTEFFRIVVTDADPNEAALIANALANTLPDQIESIIEGASARIVQNAVVPTKPSSPNAKKNTMLAAMLGVLLVCAIIFIKDLRDDVIAGEEDLLLVTDLPVLAAIPELLSSGKSGGYYSSYAPKKNS